MKALRCCAGYVIHSLMKKLQRLAPSPHQEELVLCLTELVTESELLFTNYNFYLTRQHKHLTQKNGQILLIEEL